MGKPKEAPQARAYKMGREVVNPVAPHPVRILLEPPLAPQDDFTLEVAKTGKAHAKPVRLTLEQGRVSVEFDLTRNTELYRFLHARGSEREIIDRHLPGLYLGPPALQTPGQPKMAHPAPVPPEAQSKRPEPPTVRDALLGEETTDFASVKVEEPKDLKDIPWPSQH